MLRAFGIFFGGGIVGGVVGFALAIFAYPYIFLADIVADDQVANPANRSVVATGTFVHANPNDPIHYGRGGVTVYDDLLHLGSDFAVGPGPKFHVYLVPKTVIKETADVEGTMYVDLGRLKAFKGSQNFSIPAGVDLRAYGSAVIWCERFGVLISPAKLAFAQ